MHQLAEEQSTEMRVDSDVPGGSGTTVRCQVMPFQRAAATVPPGWSGVVPTATQLSALVHDIRCRRAGGGAVVFARVAVFGEFAVLDTVAARAGLTVAVVAAIATANAVMVAAALAVARSGRRRDKLLKVTSPGTLIT
jgi:hypothetical protein